MSGCMSERQEGVCEGGGYCVGRRALCVREREGVVCNGEGGCYL